MTELSEAQALVKATFGDSMPDVIVHVECHGSLIINKKIQKSTGRVDSYDLFSLPDNFVDNILIFVLSGLSNCASTNDPMKLEVFPNVKPNNTFSNIFNDLDNIYNETNPTRFQQYNSLKAPLGSYSILPLIQGNQFTNAFINKYVYIGGAVSEDDVEDEQDDDIYIVDNEGNEFRISNLDSLAKLLAKKRGITYYAAIDLIEVAVTVDRGLIGGWEIMIPGGFDDKRRLDEDHIHHTQRIQRITFKEVLFLLYLLGYRNPLILDGSCSGNYSSVGPQSERASGRTAAKNNTPFIQVGNFYISDNEGNTNFTDYDKDKESFDEKCDRIIEDNKEYIAFIMTTVPGCSEKLALIAANANPGSFKRQTEFAHEALIVISTLGCTEEKAVEGIMANKNEDGSFNAVAAIQYLTNERGGKRIKKTMRRKKYRKSIRKKTFKQSIKRKRK